MAALAAAFATISAATSTNSLASLPAGFTPVSLAGTASRADVLLAFSESAENQAKIAPEIQNGITLGHDWKVIASPFCSWRRTG